MKVPQSDLWKYEGCEFNSDVAGQKMRIILKSVDSRHAYVTNYYHRNHTFKIKMRSFLKDFEMVV